MSHELMGSSEVISEWLSKLNDALLKKDLSAVVELFLDEECYWRDLLAFTWNIHTCESKEEITEMLEQTLEANKPSGWEIDGPALPMEGALEASIKFETSVARGRGYVKLKEGKCWVLMTAMWELKGHEEKAGTFRPQGVPYGNIRGKKSWLENRVEEEQELGHSKQPYCVVIGGGQCGIALGARLRALDVPTIVLEKNEKAGDSWRNRYKALNTHTTVWLDHMPYMNFPATWPLFSSKDQLGDWFECYVKIMRINYWGSCECKSANFDEKEGRWNLLVESRKMSSMITLRPVHLILATGSSGFVNVPHFDGADTFQGVQIHSSQYQSGEDWQGKQCVVIGACTSGHDICADLWEHGAAQVTMVQKSSTCVVNQLTLYPIPPAMENEINSSTLAVDRMDLRMFCNPYRVMARLDTPFYEQVAKTNADFYNRLTKAGFKIDFGEDGSGLLMKLFRRGGGFYMDVGASELIASGEIKVKSGVTVKEVRPKSVLFSDGSEVPADLLVYATGYKNMNAFISKLISQEVADKVGLIWGLGSGTTNDPGPWVGELRNTWKPLPQPNLWIMGGYLATSRQMSRFLALQLKARMELIDTPIFGGCVRPHSNGTV